MRKVTLQPTDAAAQAHYRLILYVCGRDCTQPSPFDEGWATFTQIYQNRPNDCRYAVAQKLPLVRYGHDQLVGEISDLFVCWDLLSPDLWTAGGPDGRIPDPDPMWVGDTEDGLVMKVMALYGKDQDDG